MQKLYVKVGGSDERINIDIYPPQVPDAGGGFENRRRPVILVVCGGGGKDPRTGSPLVGKHAAGYHDLGEAFSRAGFWGIIPSRRGDPQRTTELRGNLAPEFRHRLPEELLHDEGPNDGDHSHRRHVTELTWLVETLPSIFGSDLDVRRVRILGKSAGGGVALAAAAELGERIASVALWGSALTTSQWFAGPKSDLHFDKVLDQRGIQYNKGMFLHDVCDAIAFVGQVASPTLFTCAVPDPYAEKPPERDPWTSLEEQVELMRYAIRCRYAKVVGVKGAEHTMFAEHPAWEAYVSTLVGWFAETLLHDRKVDDQSRGETAMTENK